MYHFSVPELLQCSLVSRGLNELIGKSKTFLQKTKFVIKTVKGLPLSENLVEMESVMKSSKRKYKNLNIRATNPGEDELKLLFGVDWHDAVISITKFKSTSQYVKYLGLIAPTLSSLQLSIGKIQKIDLNIKLDSSTIKSLSFLQCTSAALEVFVRDENNLIIEKLTLSAVRQSTEKFSKSLKLIYSRFIESFSALKHLDVTSSATVDDFFRHDISGIVGFQLKSLRVQAPASLQVCQHIKKFIKSQGNSLEELGLLHWKELKTVYEIWNQTTALKVLQMTNLFDDMNFDFLNEYSLAPKELETLVLNLPKSQILDNFLLPVLASMKQQLKILDISAILQPELTEVILSSAQTVTVNGRTYVHELHFKTSDSSYDSDDSLLTFPSLHSSSSDDESQIVLTAHSVSSDDESSIVISDSD